MILAVNGSDREVPAATTVRTLLEVLGVGEAQVAVEVNGAVVPRKDHGQIRLRAGDRIEVVRFVGGG